MLAETKTVISYNDTNIRELTDSLRTIFTYVDKPTFLIAICGGRSTCKSTVLANSIQKNFGGDICTTISLDNFQKRNRLNPSSISSIGHDLPEYYNMDSCYKTLYNLKEGKQVSIPGKKSEGIGLEQILVNPCPVILVEGLFAGYGRMTELADFIIYAESPCYARLMRSIFHNLFGELSLEPIETLGKFRQTIMAHRDLVIYQDDNADICITVPYKFEDSVKRYNLKPLENSSEEFPDIIILLSQKIDDHSYFTIQKMDKGYYFIVNHKGRNYFEIPIDKELSEELCSISFNEV